MAFRLLLAGVAGLAALASTFVGWTEPASAATGWTSVTSGDRHTCGIRGGRVYCWGENSAGQLGDGTNAPHAVAKPIASRATDWTSVSAGAFHTCAVRAGRVACWGRDGDGQLGDGLAGGTRAVPALIKSGATDWRSVSSGQAHTCAVRGGRIACWGRDGEGQLGDGLAGGTRAVPALIKSGATDWRSVSAGGNHTCAVRAGRVACWGWDGTGELGDGTAGAGRASPGLTKSGASDWISVDAGLQHTCAVRVGRVACWGNDNTGQLGDGTAGGFRAYPQLIASSVADWTSISAGEYHTCAIRATRIACWGEDFFGQLGDGSPSGDTPDPVPSYEVS